MFSALSKDLTRFSGVTTARSLTGRFLDNFAKSVFNTSLREAFSFLTY